ncbi:hypothetical protein [Brucella pseudogrignonensis]|uniref:hypothetical protein n=1 Tax=Brucella pseudogrignonensis TaxID=419475 RepID=UPI003ED085AF
MAFFQLYDSVQDLPGRISTRWLRDEALRLTSITKVKEQWTGVLDERVIRGFYIEGPLGPPVPLDPKQSMIVLKRGLDKAMRRLVYTKELMHVFDEDDEKTDTPEKLDIQAEAFSDPGKQTPPQFIAENKALWRAISVLCQESRRLEFQDELIKGTKSLAVISASLQIPEVFARNLFREDYLEILEHVKHA